MNTDQIILDQFINNHPQQAALVLKDFKDEEMVAFLEAGPLDMTISIISSLSSYKAAKCLEKLNLKLASTIIEKIDLRLKRSILRQCDEGYRNQLLDAMPPKQSTMLRQNLDFTTETIGFLMNPLLLSFKKDLMVEDAISMAKNEKEHVLTNVLVVDDNGKPEGIITLHDLLFAESNTLVSVVMKTKFPKIYADEPLESVKNHPGWYEYQSIPVIDRHETLIGTLDFKAIGESEINRGEQNKNIVETSNALGELYRIGLTGLLQSVSKE